MVFTFSLITFSIFFFKNIMVKIDFKKIQDKLVGEKNMTVIHEGVLPDTQTDPETFAKLTAFRKNPIHAFKCYAFDAGVNLQNVFNADNDINLTVKDFKDLLKVCLHYYATTFVNFLIITLRLVT